MKTPTTNGKAWRLRRFTRANEAVSALEYAILVGVIALAVGAAIVTFSGSVTAPLGSIGGEVAKIKTDTGKTIK